MSPVNRDLSADEYDAAAQERGEVATRSDGDRSSKAEGLKPTVADIGLTHKDIHIHEARLVRDAEAAGRDGGQADGANTSMAVEVF